MRSPGGEPQPLQQRREPRVGAQRIEAGQPGVVEEELVRVLCPREHLEGRVDLPERAEQPALGDDRRRGRRPRAELVEERPGFVMPSCGRERPPEETQEVGPAVRNGETVLGRRDALLVPPEGDVRQARAEQRRRVVLLEGERLLGVPLRLLRPAGGQQPQRRQDVREGREGIGLPRPLEERLGVVGLLMQREPHPQQPQGRDVGGLELDRSTTAASMAFQRRSMKATKASPWRPSADSPCSSERGRERLSGALAGLLRVDQAHVRQSVRLSASPVHDGA